MDKAACAPWDVRLVLVREPRTVVEGGERPFADWTVVTRWVEKQQDLGYNPNL